MGKGDKFQKSKFSREKSFAYSEEDIVKNENKLNQVKDIRKKEREDKLNLMNNEIKGFNDEIKKYTDIQNSRIYSRASDEQKKSYQKIIDDNKVKIQNKQAEIDKLKKTPLGTPTSTSPTATTTNTATPTPKSAEDRAAIDAGGGL